MPGTAVRAAAGVTAAAFTIHMLNGLVVERAVLGLESYDDYAVVAKLQGAIGSWPWRASGLGHLLTAFAVLVLAVGLAERARRTGFAAHAVIGGLGVVAAVGYGLNGVAAGLGAQVMHLLQDSNPGVPPETAVVTMTLLVPVVNALAITMTGAMMLLVSVWAWSARPFGRGLAVLGLVAGASGLVMAFVYVPAYLLLYLAWALWLAAVGADQAAVGPQYPSSTPAAPR